LLPARLFLLPARLLLEFLQQAGLEELIELAEDVGAVGLGGELVDGEDVVGEAGRLAGRPAEDAPRRIHVLGAHPVGHGARVRQGDLAVGALLAEVVLAIGGQFRGGGEEDVFVNGQRQPPLGAVREPLAVVVGPLVHALPMLEAEAALGLRLGDPGLGLELADFSLPFGVLLLAELEVDPGAFALEAAEDVGGALTDAGVRVLELVALVVAGVDAAVHRVADAGGALELEVEGVVLKDEFVEVLVGHVQSLRHVRPGQTAGAQIGGALEHVLVVGCGGSDHGDTVGKESSRQTPSAAAAGTDGERLTGSVESGGTRSVPATD
jgi:hypothetical protein